MSAMNVSYKPSAVRNKEDAKESVLDEINENDPNFGLELSSDAKLLEATQGIPLPIGLHEFDDD